MTKQETLQKCSGRLPGLVDSKYYRLSFFQIGTELLHSSMDGSILQFQFRSDQILRHRYDIRRFFMSKWVLCCPSHSNNAINCFCLFTCVFLEICITMHKQNVSYFSLVQSRSTIIRKFIRKLESTICSTITGSHLGKNLYRILVL